MQQNNTNSLKELYGVILFFFLSLFLYSKFGPSIPFNVTSQEKGMPLVVEGTGSAVSAPDSAKVRLGIEEAGANLESLQASVSQKSEKLTSALTAIGIEEKNIKTSSYQVYPQYSFERTPQQIIGYNVSLTYEVTVLDIGKVNEVLGTATAQGANSTSGVSFELSDETIKRLTNEAREEAASEAKQKAESLAKASGVTLGKVLSVSEYSNGGRPISFAQRLDSAEVGGGEPVAPDIQPGESEISLTVSISYEIR